MTARIFSVLALVLAQVMVAESNAPLPTCLSGLNPGDRLPQDLGTVCAAETVIAIEGKGLIGTIPESIGDLSILSRLSINANQFTGGMPTAIGKLENLTQVEIVNDVGGRMPDEFWSLNALTIVGIRSPSITGSIPTTTLGLAALKRLDLGTSSFDGTIPTELVLLPQLTFLDISDNDFSGDIQQLQAELCAIDARGNVAITPGNSFTGVITDQCMYTQSIVPSSSFTASPTSSPVSLAVSAYASVRDVLAAVVLALCLTNWQL